MPAKPSVFIGSVVLVLLAAQVGQLSASDSGVTIDEVLFAPAVHNFNPVEPIVKPGGVLNAQKLYCWVKLKGGEDALETLRKEQRLPLRHIWVLAGPVKYKQLEEDDSEQEAFNKEINDLKTAAYVVLPAQAHSENQANGGVAPRFSQDLSVGKIHNAAALACEVASPRKSFDWRIWSYLKKSLSKGAPYGVVVVDRTGRILKTENGDRVFTVIYGGK